MQRTEPCLIIRLEGPSASQVTKEAEIIRERFKFRSSMSRPLPHSRREGWVMVYVDVFPASGLPLVVSQP
jgi:hypothetical protein